MTSSLCCWCSSLYHRAQVWCYRVYSVCNSWLFVIIVLLLLLLQFCIYHCFSNNSFPSTTSYSYSVLYFQLLYWYTWPVRLFSKAIVVVELVCVFKDCKTSTLQVHSSILTSIIKYCTFVQLLVSFQVNLHPLFLYFYKSINKNNLI